MTHPLTRVLPVTTGSGPSPFRVFRGLCAVAAASLLLACGGGSDGDGDAASQEVWEPGTKLLVESIAPGGGIVRGRYLVHGVTTQGELVTDQRADLIDGALVPLLEEETRTSKAMSKAAVVKFVNPYTFVNPDKLVAQQQSFFKEAWGTMAELQGTTDPRAIWRQMDDMDARMLDFMDDAAASGVTLSQYITFYDRLDKIPELAPLVYAELNIQEALSSVDKASVFDESPPACPPGLARVVSVSGLQSYCRVQAGSVVAKAGAQESNVSALLELQDLNLGNPDLDDLRLLVYLQRDRALEAQLIAHRDEMRRQDLELEKLRETINKLREDLNSKPVDCQSDPVCAEERRQMQNKLDEHQAQLGAENYRGQLLTIMMQSTMNRRNENLEVASAHLKKLQDAMRGIVTKL